MPKTDWIKGITEATNIGIVTRNMLDRLIEMTPNPAFIRMNPKVKLAKNLEGVNLYANLLVEYDPECPLDSIFIMPNE